MTEDRHKAPPLPKGQTVQSKQATPGMPKEEEKPVMISVEEILGNYPLDRDKCRDVVMLEISRSLMRIGNSLEEISQGMIVINTHLNTIAKKGPETPR